MTSSCANMKHEIHITEKLRKETKSGNEPDFVYFLSFSIICVSCFIFTHDDVMTFEYLKS